MHRLILSPGKNWPCIRVGLYGHGGCLCRCCLLSTFISCCKISHPAALLHHNLLTLRNEFLPAFFTRRSPNAALKPRALIYHNFPFQFQFKVRQGKLKVKFSIQLIKNGRRKVKWTFFQKVSGICTLHILISNFDYIEYKYKQK